MALTDGNGLSAADIAAVTGANNGFGFGGDGAWWIIILFLFAFMGNGWGNGYGNGGGYSGEMQRGFDQQAVMNGINTLGQGQFAAQTAIDGRLDSLAMAQQQGLCENRAAVADLKYTIAQESAATRSNTDTKVQAVMDKLCQLELDGVKQNYENRIAGMQNQIDALQYKVNNSDRNVALANEVDALYNRLNNCPVPSMPVYGRTPIFTCNQQNPGCGCS